MTSVQCKACNELDLLLKECTNNCIVIMWICFAYVSGVLFPWKLETWRQA